MHFSHCLTYPLLLGLHQDILYFVDGRGVAYVLNELLSNGLTLAGEVAGLEIVYSLPHIAVSDKQQSLERFLCDLHIFSFNHSFEIELHLIVFQLPKAEDNASALDGLNDLRRSIAAENEPSCLAEVADYHPQGMLGALGQTISLVQNDDLCFPLRERDFLLGERFDLVSNNVDSSFIGGV